MWKTFILTPIRREDRGKIRFKRRIPGRNEETYANCSNRSCEDRIHGRPLLRKALPLATPNRAMRCLVVLQPFAETDNFINRVRITK